MILNKYNDFLLESMVNESKVVFSNNFRLLLGKVDDVIANKVLSIENKDLDVTSNFIDIDKEKNDTVTFTPDRRAQEIINDTTEYVRFNGRNGGWLKITPGNAPMFRRLGFEPTSDTTYSPNSHEIGRIVSRAKSNTTDNEYAYVKFENGEGVFNIEKLRILPSTDKESTVWSKFRQEIKVGRIVRALLTSNKESFTDRDIEVFVNNYKASMDKFNDKFSYFEIVKGDKIHYWYDGDRYYSRYGGTLGNSCMKSAGRKKLSLYTDNDSVELVIYKSPDDESKILGRAILWTLTNGKKFLDRVYYNRDSDENLFHEFAKENGFYYKPSAFSSNIYDSNGSIVMVNLVASVNRGMERFPYVDTLVYYNTTAGLIAYKHEDLGDGVIYSLHCTAGGIDDGWCTGCKRGSDKDCPVCHGEGQTKIYYLRDYDDEDYDEDDD